MTNDEAAIQKIMQNNNGLVTTAQVTEAGIPRRCLSSMIESGKIYRIERGIYSLPEVWEDELYAMQYRFSKAFFHMKRHYDYKKSHAIIFGQKKPAIPYRNAGSVFLLLLITLETLKQRPIVMPKKAH